MRFDFCCYLLAIGLDNIADTGVWTAGNDNSIEGIWEWYNPISHISAVINEQEYDNWGTGQPDNSTCHSPIFGVQT